MKFFGQRERIDSIMNGADIDQSFAEEQERKDAAIREVLAIAAIKNAMTEAGQLFTVKVPGENPDIDEIELRTHGSSEALALAQKDGTILFQATATSALVKYTDFGPILSSDDETRGMAAD